MTIDYKIGENDFLTHQLFLASKSDRIKKKRQRNKILVPLIYAALGLFFLFENKFLMTLIFFMVGLLWFFIYPLWERRHYINHYKGFIKENYKDRIGKMGTLVLNNDFILAKDSGSESKILTSELELINEIPSSIIIRIKGGQSLLLPKDKIPDIKTVIITLQELATILNIKYDIDENWEWR